MKRRDAIPENRLRFYSGDMVAKACLNSKFFSENPRSNSYIGLFTYIGSSDMVHAFRNIKTNGIVTMKNDLPDRFILLTES